MAYYIKEILLDNGAERYSIESSSDKKRLKNLSKINIFVGPNNSGKSRFLRLLANTKQLKFLPSGTNMSKEDAWTAIRKHSDRFLDWATQLFRRHGIGSFNEYPQGLNEVRVPDHIMEGQPIFAVMLQRLGKIATLPPRHSGTSTGRAPDDAFLAAFSRAAQETLQRIEEIKKECHCPDSYKFRKVYFPTLRGLRPFDAKHEDYYSARTQRDHFQPTLHTDIFTGLKLYESLQKLLLGSLQDRQTVALFEQFLSRHFFEGKSISLIPKLGNDVVDVKIGDEKEYPIYALGDGIQAIIILTFPLFQHRNEEVLVFFEEPEIYMHPGLQRIFLKALCDYFPQHQYFLTTHSNHFLDITLDLGSRPSSRSMNSNIVSTVPGGKPISARRACKRWVRSSRQPILVMYPFHT